MESVELIKGIDIKTSPYKAIWISKSEEKASVQINKQLTFWITPNMRKLIKDNLLLV